MHNIKEKMELLRAQIRNLGSAAVAYSGGVDSTLVAKICHDELGKNAIAVTAVSPSYPGYELEQAKKTASSIGIEHMLVESEEIKDANYLENTPKRCYFCKSDLYSKLRKIADEHNIRNIVNGINKEDEGDFRPGMKAAEEHGVISPLKELGFGKSDIMEAAFYLSLTNWNKPASPCLSSRVPHGIAITPEILKKIELAENVLRSFSMRVFRVRYYGNVAGIETDPSEFHKLVENSRAICSEFKNIGFRHVFLNLDGFKSGNLNEVVYEISKTRKTF